MSPPERPLTIRGRKRNPKISACRGTLPYGGVLASAIRGEADARADEIRRKRYVDRRQWRLVAVFSGQQDQAEPLVYTALVR